MSAATDQTIRVKDQASPRRYTSQQSSADLKGYHGRETYCPHVLALSEPPLAGCQASSNTHSNKLQGFAPNRCNMHLTLLRYWLAFGTPSMTQPTTKPFLCLLLPPCVRRYYPRWSEFKKFANAVGFPDGTAQKTDMTVFVPGEPHI